MLYLIFTVKFKENSLQEKYIESIKQNMINKYEKQSGDPNLRKREFTSLVDKDYEKANDLLSFKKSHIIPKNTVQDFLKLFTEYINQKQGDRKNYSFHKFIDIFIIDKENGEISLNDTKITEDLISIIKKGKNAELILNIFLKFSNLRNKDIIYAALHDLKKKQVSQPVTRPPNPFGGGGGKGGFLAELQKRAPSSDGFTKKSSKKGKKTKRSKSIKRKSTKRNRSLKRKFL
jgi:hypothetical protein